MSNNEDVNKIIDGKSTLLVVSIFQDVHFWKSCFHFHHVPLLRLWMYLSPSSMVHYANVSN